MVLVSCLSMRYRKTCRSSKVGVGTRIFGCSLIFVRFSHILGISRFLCFAVQCWVGAPPVLLQHRTPYAHTREHTNATCALRRKNDIFRATRGKLHSCACSSQAACRLQTPTHSFPRRVFSSANVMLPAASNGGVPKGALRVSRAETRLTVHRPLQVRPTPANGHMWGISAP